MRKISKAMKEGKVETKYAHCCVCQETFIDDVSHYVMCPNGCPVLLEKGYLKGHILGEPILPVENMEEQPCLWDAMPETYPGSGTKIGMLSCPCPRCSPRC